MMDELYTNLWETLKSGEIELSDHSYYLISGATRYTYYIIYIIIRVMLNNGETRSIYTMQKTHVYQKQK